MNVSADTLLILAGLIANVSGTLFGFWKLTLRFENRLTRVETALEHLPKRHGDVIA